MVTLSFLSTRYSAYSRTRSAFQFNDWTFWTSIVSGHGFTTSIPHVPTSTLSKVPIKRSLLQTRSIDMSRNRSWWMSVKFMKENTGRREPIPLSIPESQAPFWFRCESQCDRCCTATETTIGIGDHESVVDVTGCRGKLYIANFFSRGMQVIK
jgi:hypothetical protein